MSESDERTIGRLEVKIETFEDQVERMSDDVREIRELIALAKGGYRTLIAVGLVLSVVGAALTGKLLHRLGMLPRWRGSVAYFAEVGSAVLLLQPSCFEWPLWI